MLYEIRYLEQHSLKRADQIAAELEWDLKTGAGPGFLQDPAAGPSIRSQTIFISHESPEVMSKGLQRTAFSEDGGKILTISKIGNGWSRVLLGVGAIAAGYGVNDLMSSEAMASETAPEAISTKTGKLNPAEPTGNGSHEIQSAAQASSLAR